MISYLAFLIGLGFVGPAFAGLTSFCGDLSRLNNEALVNVIALNDVSQKFQVHRTQCGLPGESLPICSSCETSTSEAVMQVLRPMVGRPNHLNWHSGWHQMRTSKEFLRSRAGLTGEDFFYMHRLMIKMVQLELAGAGQPCIAPWTELPNSVLDSTWPVPKKLDDTQVQKAEQELKALRELHGKWRNPARLKNVSLDQLGRAIEPGLHQSLHNFYRGNPLCSREARAQGFCDDLIPPQTSPLNKYFWKIHGLIDELVGLWLTANGYQEISVQCDSRPGCYQWNGTWIGEYPKD